MDMDAVNAFLIDLKKWNPDEIILNGDIIECGGFLATHHTLGFVSQTEYTFQDDIAKGNWFLDEVQKAAPKAIIHFIAGNHEDRIEKWIVDQTLRNTRESEFLRKLLGPEVLLKLNERGINYYTRGAHHVKGLPPGWIKLGKVFFTHELGGGKNAASAAVSRTAGNVVFAHTHQESSASATVEELQPDQLEPRLRGAVHCEVWRVPALEHPDLAGVVDDRFTPPPNYGLTKPRSGVLITPLCFICSVFTLSS